MALFAQIFRVGQVEHDLLQTIGLLIAAIILGVLAFRHVRSEAAKRPRLVAVLALIAIATVAWSAIESGTRLWQGLADQWNRNAPTRDQLMKWEYVEILKDEKGQVIETGNKHPQQAAGGEFIGIKEKTLEVVEVGPAKAKFRLSNDKTGGKQEAEVVPGSSQDLWLESSPSGIRIRVEGISPVQK
jgi:hypothetical protein